MAAPFRTTCSEWKKLLPGYDLYFVEGPPHELGNIDRKVRIISSFLARNGYLEKEKLKQTELCEYFEVNFDTISKDKQFMRDWPDFENHLTFNPNTVILVWSSVMHKIISEIKRLNTDDEEIDEQEELEGENSTTKIVYNKESMLKENGNVGMIMAGIMRHTPVMPLQSITSYNIGHFVTIRGTIIGTSTPRPVCIKQTFLCKHCKSTFLVYQPEGRFTLPEVCGAGLPNCRNENKKFFEVLETADSTVMTEYRKIRVQERQNLDIAVGAVPPTTTCELSNSLVHRSGRTGDCVTITGIVKIKKDVSTCPEKNNLFSTYIHVIAIKMHKDSERTAGGQLFSLENKDYCAISAIQETPNLFRLLVASVCPLICGMENVKAGLLLSLFGGSTCDAKNELTRRGNINVLMVGDPGIGKSQLLQYVSNLSSRGVYICGSGTTAAGLTVTLVKNKDSGEEYTLEPGALVLADQGVCCIDEFDKMKATHPALLEVMEMQSVSIAKAGVFRTLPAQTTVIAASNPFEGHYDQRRSVIDNIGISPALLSRFDIVFILLDEPNQERDQKIVEHVFRMTTTLLQTKTNEPIPTEQEHSLLDRLKVQKSEELDLVPAQLVQKYIAYARRYVNPILTPEAASVLKKYYMNLRITHSNQQNIPITARQLESLMRLTQARAKVELRETASAADANDAIEIFESGLYNQNNICISTGLSQNYINLSGTSQASRNSSMTSNPKSHSVQAKCTNFKVELQKCAIQLNKNIFTEHEMILIAHRLGYSTVEATKLIYTLNNVGDLLMQGGKVYKLQ